LDDKWVISECTYTELSDTPFPGTGKSAVEADRKGVEMFCPGGDPSSVSGNSGVDTGDQLKRQKPQ